MLGGNDAFGNAATSDAEDSIIDVDADADADVIVRCIGIARLDCAAVSVAHAAL
jgi:hypothetical protein